MVAQDDAYVRAQEWQRTCADGSLERKLREDSSLWVHPLYWTQKHVQALNCTFEEIPGEKPVSEASSQSASENARESAQELGLEVDLMDDLSRLSMTYQGADKDIIMRRIMLQMASMFLPRDQIKAK